LASRLGRFERLLHLLAQGLVTAAAATGLLYLLRAELPPAILPLRDAVPLDELPGHDAVSLILFALVLPTAAAAVLLLTSPARQSPQPLPFGLATSCCSFVSCAVSLEIVRQTSTAQALTAAAAVPAVYAAGLLAGLAAILVKKVA
jgi:hypothetical protein